MHVFLCETVEHSWNEIANEECKYHSGALLHYALVFDKSLPTATHRSYVCVNVDMCMH